MTDDLLTSLDRVIAHARTIDEPILRAAREEIVRLRQCHRPASCGASDPSLHGVQTMSKQREALELARECVATMSTDTALSADTLRMMFSDLLPHIDAALAAPDPQPVAAQARYMVINKGHMFYAEGKGFGPWQETSLSCLPKDGALRHVDVNYLTEYRLLYAAPVAPARELSDEQIAEMAGDAFSWIDMQEPDHEDRLIDTAVAFARAVLAAAKEK